MFAYLLENNGIIFDALLFILFSFSWIYFSKRTKQKDVEKLEKLEQQRIEEFRMRCYYEDKEKDRLAELERQKQNEQDN